MATLTVTITDDVVDAGDGVLSLREAVTQANLTSAADVIQFAPGIEGQMLVLWQGELVVSRDATIDGDANNDGTEVTLGGNARFEGGEGFGNRVLSIVGGDTDVELRDVTLADGYSSEEAGAAGGAVMVGGGSLTLSHATIRDSTAGDGFAARGGAIYAGTGSQVTISDSSLLTNRADRKSYAASGGVIAAGSHVDLTSRNSYWPTTPPRVSSILEVGRSFSGLMAIWTWSNRRYLAPIHILERSCFKIVRPT